MSTAHLATSSAEGSGVALDPNLELLRARSQFGLWVVLACVALITLADARLPDGGSRALHLTRALEFALVGVGFVLNRLRTGRRMQIAFGVGFVGSIYVASAATCYLRNDPRTQLVTNIALAFGTATTLPWGAWPQLVSAVVAGLAAAVGTILVHGGLAGISAHMAAAVVIALVTSVYIAYQIERYRLERDRAEEERAASMRELAQARDQALASTRAKSAFLANTSHEIRTPMNVIIGMTDIALDEKLPPAARESLTRVRAAALALLGIINDILDHSKIEAGKLSLESADLDVRAIVEELTSLLSRSAAQKGLRLTCRLPSDLPAPLLGDPGRLRQVLTNLIGNAVKFTEHGHVDIDVEVRRQTAECAQLRFTVTDTGIGIPRERQVAVFESFTQVDDGTTRTHGGTGLGLTICRQLVELMGGQIGLQSEPGRGSRFTVDLAFERRADSEPRARPAA